MDKVRYHIIVQREETRFPLRDQTLTVTLSKKRRGSVFPGRPEACLGIKTLVVSPLTSYRSPLCADFITLLATTLKGHLDILVPHFLQAHGYLSWHL